jgi:spore maturation protein CgeB
MGRENLSDEEFRDLLFDIKPVCFIVMSYFREKIMDAIVAAEVPVHVFGDSWKQERYKRAKCLIRHPNLTPDESLRVYAQSKISLNIMSWHKAGMTERIANMMLNHAVTVTDESKYLVENYVEGEDYLAISLTDIAGVPKVLRQILEDEKKQQEIAESAYEKARNKETWACRAKRIMEIIDAIGE